MKKLVKQKTIDLKMDCEQWVRMGRALATWDEMQDRVQSRSGCFGCLSFFLIIPTVFILGANDLEYLFPYIIPPIGFFMIFSTLTWWMCKHADLPNRFRGAVLLWTRILKEDTKKNAPLSMTIDLRGATKDKFVKKFEPYEKDNCRIKEKLYMDPWWQGNAQLKDRSKLSWLITDELIEREKQKLYGKRKTKVKWKAKSHYEIKISIDKSQYTLKAKPEDVLPKRLPGKYKWNLKDSSERWTFILKSSIKSELYDEDTFDHTPMVQQISSVYAILQSKRNPA